MASFLPVAVQVTRRRIRGKQAAPEVYPPEPQHPRQLPHVAVPDYAADERDNARKMVYLVTFPHPRIKRTPEGYDVVAPESFGREAILQKLLDACARPICTDTRANTSARFVDVLRAGVFFESHKEDEAAQVHKHAHVSLCASARFYFLPVKRALLAWHGLVSHWSCSREGYWSVVRYLFVPSPKKPADTLDRTPYLWAKGSTHPPLDECSNEPLTAPALAAKRLKLEHTAAEKGKAAPRITEFDVYPIIVNNGFKNTSNSHTAHLELIAFAKESCSREM